MLARVQSSSQTTTTVQCMLIVFIISCLQLLVDFNYYEDPKDKYKEVTEEGEVRELVCQCTLEGRTEQKFTRARIQVMGLNEAATTREAEGTGARKSMKEKKRNI